MVALSEAVVVARSIPALTKSSSAKLSVPEFNLKPMKTFDGAYLAAFVHRAIQQGLIWVSNVGHPSNPELNLVLICWNRKFYVDFSMSGSLRPPRLVVISGQRAWLLHLPKTTWRRPLIGENWGKFWGNTSFGWSCMICSNSRIPQPLRWRYGEECVVPFWDNWLELWSKPLQVWEYLQSTHWNTNTLKHCCNVTL